MKKIIFLFFCFGIFIVSRGQWSDDPDANNLIAGLSGEETIPKVVVAENGNSYISWFSNENGNYNVRLQQLDIEGYIQWAQGGLLISDHPSMTWLTDWDLKVDQEGYAILAFQDIRNNGSNNIYVYRISPDGDFIWGEDGLELSNSVAFDVSPKLSVTGENNVVVAWQADDVIILQKISPEGDLLFGEEGITISGDNTLSWPQLLAVGNDDFILKYFDDSGPYWAPTRLVFAQRFDGDGDPVWSEPVSISDAAGISSWNQIFPMINDGNDGFFITWHDDRDGNMLSSVFVHHIDVNGNPVFPVNGVEASTLAARNNFYPVLAFPENSEDIFVIWNEMDADQNLRGIYGQKISGSGERLWSDNGKVFIEISATDVLPTAMEKSDVDMVLFYEEVVSGMNSYVKAMRLDLDGNFVWPEQFSVLSSVLSAKSHPVVSPFNSGQWIASWNDDRNGQTDIYAQNIQLDGSLGPVGVNPDLDIYPDTIYCEVYGPHFVYIENNTEITVTINAFNFEYEYCWLPNPPSLPFILEAGENLELEVDVNIPVVEMDEYVQEYFHIETDINSYQIVFYINEDLLFGGNTELKHAEHISVGPNPFCDRVTFVIHNLPSKMIQLKIYSTTGNCVHIDSILQDGETVSQFIWNGKDQNGIKVKNGLYYYEISAGEKRHTGKIIFQD